MTRAIGVKIKRRRIFLCIQYIYLQLSCDDSFKKIQAFNIIQVSLRLEQWSTPSHTTTHRLYCVVTALTFCRWLTWHVPLVPRCGVYGSAVLWRTWFSPSPQGYVPLRHAQYHSAVDKDSRLGSQHLVFKFFVESFHKTHLCSFSIYSRFLIKCEESISRRF